MEILKTRNGTSLTVTLNGRLDTVTSPELEKTLEAELGTTQELTFDLSDLAYVSSAGLRIFLMTQKQINRQGGRMTVMHVAPEIREVFDITGFSDFLTIV